MRKILVFSFCLLIITHLLPAQEIAPLGIFDATADWGIGGEFGEKFGDYKVPGHVKVSRDEKGEYVYDVYGNGDIIFNETDEVFMLMQTRKVLGHYQAKSNG